MNEAKRVEIETLRRLGPEGRLEMAHRLYWTARELKTAGLRHTHPDWTEERVQAKVRELFLYGGS
jgi:hypothetical protein